LLTRHPCSALLRLLLLLLALWGCNKLLVIHTCRPDTTMPLNHSRW
jgi:hypothetical protein